MIPRAHITEWRALAPWSLDSQVEQDLALSRVIVEIFSDSQICEKVVFRGGTALHKLFLRPARRYSEDIDLVQWRAEPIGPVMNAIRARLDPWLGKPQWKQGEGRVTLYYRFLSEEDPPQKMRLKVEINTREHFSVFPLERKFFDVQSSWFSGKADISTYRLEELLGSKLRALYQRRKSRDLFDLSLALLDHPNIDVPAILEAFHKYLEHGKHKISRADFEANLAEKKTNQLFLDDLPPLLPPKAANFDAVKAIEEIEAILIAKLPGAPWKKKSP